VYPLWSIWGTLPETNIAPENVPLEEEIHLYKPILGFYASFLGCTTVFGREPSKCHSKHARKIHPGTPTSLKILGLRGAAKDGSCMGKALDT